MIRQGWPVADGIPISAGPWKIDKASVDVGKGTVVLTPVFPCTGDAGRS